jgi:hypothetical protein
MTDKPSESQRESAQEEENLRVREDKYRRQRIDRNAGRAYPLCL